jgi:predicted O-linked N-acetylglucosamine transferase (SPINDLY family)
MGLPVVTIKGRSYAARVAASLLTAAGLPELIARDHAEYQALAIALARDPARLGVLGQKLAAARTASPLFDTPAYTRHLETAYATMIARHDAGLAPDHIHIAP